MSCSLQAMRILAAFSTPHATKACHWLADCANVFFHQVSHFMSLPPPNPSETSADN